MSSIIKVNTVQDVDGNNIINENANTITIGKSGDTVQVASGASLVGAGIEWQSTVVTGATHTASANQGIWINTTSNACNLTLPGSPSVGDQLIFSDFARTWASNAVTLTLNGSKYQGNTTPVPVYDTEGETVHIVYSGSTQGWIPINDGAVAMETPQNYSAEYFCVGGGGGGGMGVPAGGSAGGGGGAGGVLTNFGGTAITLVGGATYTVTVGSAGAQANSPPGGAGGDGGDSILSGSGISTITALGGGGGGGQGAGSGRDGGSGGGASRETGPTAYGSGTAPQGNRGGGANVGHPYYPGAGGGGKGAVGQDAQSGGGGNGGAGEANSITGSSVTYAGGGGGAIAVTGGTPGSGGSGGGGAGAPYDGKGVAGTANTGGGGGASSNSGSDNSGAGGTGVVILRVATSKYSGTTTGSPTVTTDGSDTVIKFTGSGSYTA